MYFRRNAPKQPQSPVRRVRYIKSGKSLMICHCECNEVKRRNRLDSGITSLRYRYIRNDKGLVGHDIRQNPKIWENTRNVFPSSRTKTTPVPSYS